MEGGTHILRMVVIEVLYFQFYANLPPFSFQAAVSTPSLTGTRNNEMEMVFDLHLALHIDHSGPLS